MSDEAESWTMSGPLTQHAFTFCGQGRTLLKITADGRIEIGDGFEPDEAGRKAIEGMRHQLNFIVEQARQEVRDEFERHGYKIVDGKVRRLLDGRWVRIVNVD